MFTFSKEVGTYSSTQANISTEHTEGIEELPRYYVLNWQLTSQEATIHRLRYQATRSQDFFPIAILPAFDSRLTTVVTLPELCRTFLQASL